MTQDPMERPDGEEMPPTVAGSGEGASGAAGGDLVGRVLGGRYRILRKLGEGAMGAVYLGEHLKIGRQDAIKVLRDSLATDADTIARFVRGTRNVSMIRHPNICTIYDYSDTGDGVQFVAMEFVPGETLGDLLQREGKLSVERAVHIARQAADALEAAHEVGIVHRDLKPANIMVVPGRGGVVEVKVVDFDIAKGSRDGEGEEVTRMGFVVGTPEYMSPEQLIGDRLDGRSDIYSLALVLYRMLTGILPFAAEDTQDLMVKRLTEDPMTLGAGLPTGSFPPALEAAIRRALQRKPAERQASAGEFGREISAAVESPATIGSDRTRMPTPPQRRADSAAKREPSRPIPLLVKAAGGGGVLLLLIVAGVLAFGGGVEEEPPPSTAQLDDAQTPIVEYADPEATPEASDEERETLSEVVPTGQSEQVPTTTAAASGNTEAEAEPGPSPVTQPPPPTQDELLDILLGFGDSATGATLVAGRDAAIDAWNHPDASAIERATAAYVASSAYASLGDTAQALTWIDNALALRPGFAGYMLLRNTLQPSSAGY